MYSRISLLIALFVVLAVITRQMAQEPSETPTPAATTTGTSTQTPTITLTPTITPTFTPQGEELVTLIAVADGYVNSDNPGDNYGSSRSLRLDATPDIRSYLRFDTSYMDGTIYRVTLRIYANSASTAGFEVHALDEDEETGDATWDEESLTFTDAPPVGTLIATVGPFGEESWTEADLTEFITDFDIYDLVLVPLNDTAINLSSLDGDNPPELVIDFTGELFPTETPTPTATRRPTRTPTPDEGSETEEADS
jgi:hypothetical protein